MEIILSTARKKQQKDCGTMGVINLVLNNLNYSI
ncbi:Uncharacterised protein [Chryseobacterium carnipullorum]|uniref:Uncharacterized protein n=1 Tax=Chryseobacterium carnipullorum TaxID=1124835 RepID=A0A376DXP6_CHRCU|nr:Uncharacterised protein [Chryseobacterium carnipullorum]